MQNRTFRSWIVLVIKLSLLSFMAVALSFVLFTVANFGDSVDKLFLYIKMNDAEMTKKELINLHYYYDLSRRWKVQHLADKYLFRDALFYEVADFQLIKDWDKVMNALKEKLDDPRSYPYGNAKFRQAKALYSEGKTKEALNLVSTEVASDYEKALRNCLMASAVYDDCFDRVWNYDLATNKKDAEEALKGPEPKVKYILGPPIDKDGNPILPPPLIPGGGKEGEEPPGSGGGFRRRP